MARVSEKMRSEPDNIESPVNWQAIAFRLQVWARWCHLLERANAIIGPNVVAEGIRHVGALWIRLLVEFEALGATLPCDFEQVGAQLPASDIDEDAHVAEGVAQHAVHRGATVLYRRV